MEINDDPMRRVLVDAMRRAGLAETEQQAIAATICRRLLGLGGPAQP